MIDINDLNSLTNMFLKTTLSFALSQSYIKRFLWYNLYDSHSVLRFSLHLHYHTGCSYRVKKICSNRLLNLQKSEHNEWETSCSSYNYCPTFKKEEKEIKTKREKRGWNFGLKEGKALGVYKTFLAEFRFERECNYKNYLWMTSENFEEIFQVINDDIRKEKAKMREAIPPRLKLGAAIRFLSTGESYKSL